ncbi:MAG: NAD-dependent epimerase/dehydratase family protein [Tannerellaceae bacterium]|jgi:nucleoside-diphosphate-sugar epimerase|nr:NAD-dependent epimerase/dehydratase family protein [Tannerellaceae bacterium]
MKTAIIGGSGFVGTRLIEKLHNEFDITNIDKKQSDFFNNITIIADVRDKATMKSLLAGHELVILLAAEHRDDVSPTSLYYDVNVGGVRNTLEAMEKNGIKRIIFTSSVAVYGLNGDNPDENSEPAPFNHYGKSKWQAEQILQKWYETHKDWNINIIRPTVVFGERNRGNVYNLLKQIANGFFLMVGKGDNVKSMAYVGNVVAFIKYLIEHSKENYNVFNYIDKPDYCMNELLCVISQTLHKHISRLHLPYWLGMFGGKCFDLLSFIICRKLPISSVRIKKIAATTQFDSSKAMNSGFIPDYTLKDGLERTIMYEFINKNHPDNIVFESE